MPLRALHLITTRSSSLQRAHFSIFVPAAIVPSIGTKIHVVGAPMAGYKLEFKRNYAPGRDRDVEKVVLLGLVEEENVVEVDACESSSVTDETGDARESVDDTPRTKLEKAAIQVPPPRISENFMGPVNDTTNRRCQEWTMDFVGRLVALGMLSADAVGIVQAHRDPPGHGIGLRPIRHGDTYGDGGG